jgi:hypothetical protein
MYNANPSLRGLDDVIEYEDWMVEELKKCVKDPIYFIEKYIKIIDGDSGLISFILRDYQKDFIKSIHENNYSQALFPRQCGKSVTVGAYCCWYALFNSNKNVVMLAHQKAMSTEQLGRIKRMIEELPMWLQQPIVAWNEWSIKFANKSKMSASATQTKSVRGFTVNFLHLDEFAFVEPHIANEFIGSVFPTISSMDSAKMVITSTPNGLDHFWEMWTKGIERQEKGNLGPKDFRCSKIAWNVVPGRDEKWKKDQIDKIGEVRFLQEYACEFHGSVATLVDSNYLATLKTSDPIAVLDERRLRIYKWAMKESTMTYRGYEYFITVDPAMGTKQDYSVVQVWLIKSNTDIEQVAVYEANDIPPIELVNKILGVAKLYYNPLILIENNEQGGAVVASTLHYQHNYLNLLNMQREGLGFYMTHDKKILACSLLQCYMEKGLLVINDQRTIQQLSMFGKRGNTYKAIGDGHDDLVTSMLSVLYYINSEYYYGTIDPETIYAKKKIPFSFKDSTGVTDADGVNALEKLKEKEEIPREAVFTLMGSGNSAMASMNPMFSPKAILPMMRSIGN